MRVRGFNPTHDYMLISNNKIDVMNGGDPDIPTKFVEINVNGADNFWVDFNHIKNINTFVTGNNRWGFFLANGAIIPAKGNLFTSNVIYAGGAADDGCCAMHAQDAGPWKICSNITDNTYRGFHIVGNCGKSAFGLNTIKNHNVDPLNLFVGGTGLFIQGNGADNGFLGDQNCQQNMWTVTDYALPNAHTAIIVGNTVGNTVQPASPSTLLKNEFRVKNLADATQAPIDRNPFGNWFSQDPCLPTPDSTDCLDQHLTPDFDEHDDWVRDNYPYPQASPGVEEWQSTRYVLAKLMRYPALATGNVLAFRNAYGQSSAALFAHFDSLMNALSLATAGSQTTLNGLETSVKNKQAQINALDASISDYTNLQSGLLSNRAVLMGELALISIQRNALLAQNTSLRAPLLDACEQFNNALPANQIYEQNQKLLNTLAIQQARSIELTQADKNALHAIAQQCIQIAGRTKAAAASMLPSEEGAQYWRENPAEYNCPQRRERGVGLQEISFLLSPNPCSDFLLIQFEAPFAGELFISDLSGRVVQSQLVQEKAEVFSIPVGQLNIGVYLLTCTDASNKTSTKAKFVVLR